MLLKKLVLMILIFVPLQLLAMTVVNMKELNVLTRKVIPDTAFLFLTYWWTLADNMTSKLVYIDHRGDIQPFLAKSWKITQDGRRYTFYLNERGKFSNGEPITAQDVVFTFKRLILLNYELHYKIKDILVDAEKLKKINDNIRGIKVVSDYVVEFNMKHKQENFIFLLSLADSGVISEKTISKKLKIVNWNVSSGAYYMNTDGTNYILKSNEYFLLDNNPFFKKINLIEWVNKNQELLTLFKSKKLDVANYWIVPNDNLIDLASKNKLQVMIGEFNRNHYFLISTKRYSSLAERKRLACLLNEMLYDVKIEKKLYQKRSMQYLPEYMGGSLIVNEEMKNTNFNNVFNYNKKKSILILGDKYSNGNLIVQFENIIKEKKLPLILKFIDSKQFLSKNESMDYDVLLIPVSLSEKYIESCLQYCISREIYKKTELYSRLDELLQKGMQSDSKIEKAKYFREISRILIEESVIVPIAYTATTFIAQPNIEFVDFNPFDGKLEFWKIREKEL